MVLRVILLLFLLVAPRAIAAQSGAQSAAQPFTTDEWRAWFKERRFGEDPYFYFASGERGRTTCPEGVRLTLVGVDSAQIHLEVDADQVMSADQPPACRVRYDEMTERPHQGEMEPGRTLWRLSVRVASAVR